MMSRLFVGLALLPLVACGTETIGVESFLVKEVTDAPPGGGDARLHVARVGNFLTSRWETDGPHASLKIKLNGQYVVGRTHGEEFFVGATDGIPIAFDVPAGAYLLELERGGHQVATRATLTVTAGSVNEVLVHGGEGHEQSKVFVDELGGLEPGQVRARVVNLMDTEEPVKVLSCARQVCTREYGACPGSECEVLQESLAYGAVWEAVVPRSKDVRASIAPRTTAEDKIDVVTMRGDLGGDPAFATMLPSHVYGPDNTACPNCPHSPPPISLANRTLTQYPDE